MIKLFLKYIGIVVFSLGAFNANAQRVGLVLSGGGAPGLVHVGVIKALEENGIPIDYIAGTSMGAIVGGLYASGYSPDEIIQIMSSPKLRDMVEGNIENKNTYFLKKKDPNASWINFRFTPGKFIQKSIPTNMVSSYALDLGIMDFFTQISAVADYDFDSLFVPFRCVAADVETKDQIVFREGNLGQAVRSSSAYPFYFKPVNYYGHILFDGGLYNNFPADILYKDFNPDYIVGSNISGNPKTPDEENIVSQIRSMLQNKTNYNVERYTKGVLIDMSVPGASLFDFTDVMPIINAGYTYTMQRMDSIKAAVKRRVDKNELAKRREEFKKRKIPFMVDYISVEGLDRHQTKYVEKILHAPKDTATQYHIDDFKKYYYRLIADDKIKHIYPLGFLNKNTGRYYLTLKCIKEKSMNLELGGNLSSRPISTGFVGLEYSHLGRVGTTFKGNFYFGRLYTSGMLGVRLDFPTYKPLALEIDYTANHWDFYRTSTAFFNDFKPSFLILNDTKFGVNLVIPSTNKGKFKIGASSSSLSNQYYQTTTFTKKDTADTDNFYFYTGTLSYERNSLNRKQYANAGSYLLFKLKYYYGEEQNTPGNLFRSASDINTIFGYYRKIHNWVQGKLVIDTYLKQRGAFRFGVYGEAVARFNVRDLFATDSSFKNVTKQFFANYTATQLVSPAFQPIAESKTLFLSNFRANQYLAGGLKTLVKLPFNLDLRLEGYIFQPVFTVLKDINNKAYYSKPFEYRTYMATSTFVYNSPIGPLSFAVNYYDKFENSESNFSFIFSFGYLLFNKSALD